MFSRLLPLFLFLSFLYVPNNFGMENLPITKPHAAQQTTDRKKQQKALCWSLGLGVSCGAAATAVYLSRKKLQTSKEKRHKFVTEPLTFQFVAQQTDNNQPPTLTLKWHDPNSNALTISNSITKQDEKPADLFKKTMVFLKSQLQQDLLSQCIINTLKKVNCTNYPYSLMPVLSSADNDNQSSCHSYSNLLTLWNFFIKADNNARELSCLDHNNILYYLSLSFIPPFSIANSQQIEDDFNLLSKKLLHSTHILANEMQSLKQIIVSPKKEAFPPIDTSYHSPVLDGIDTDDDDNDYDDDEKKEEEDDTPHDSTNTGRTSNNSDSPSLLRYPSYGSSSD
ncbi:MAG: hypothetical protein WBQ73_03335 [Candidatus Babeliales bacterium]